MTPELLLDHSAYSRLNAAGLEAGRRNEVLEAIEDLRVSVCLPFLLEAGYSARSARDHAATLRALLAFPRAEPDAATTDRALEAQRQLAGSGHHRLPPVDLIIAALADRHGLGVLHYDADYDVIAERTGLEFDSVWLAPRGTL